MQTDKGAVKLVFWIIFILAIVILRIAKHIGLSTGTINAAWIIITIGLVYLLLFTLYRTW